MKLLILNTKTFSYTLHHETPVAEEVKENLTHEDFKNSLAVFVAIENKDNENTVKEAGRDIYQISILNKSNLVLLNPFAHLTSRLAKPAQAISLLDKLAENLCQYAEFKTERLTFGWYKEFSLDVKGENNSQIYREY